MLKAAIFAFLACFVGLCYCQTCPAGQKCGDGTQHFLMIGNPGVGKSTILNGFAGKFLFKSGTSFGKGLTYQLDEARVGNRIFMDTPGLADIEMRKKAAEQITLALKKGGEFKIFFVVTLEAGRVKPADVTTIKLVLDAIPINNGEYSIIVNKLEPEDLETLLTDKDARNSVLQGIMATMPKKTMWFHWATRQDSLAGKKDQILPLDAEFEKFIENAPSVFIPSEAVKDIQTDQFEQLTEKFETMISKMKEDTQALKAQMEKDRALFEDMLKKAREENRRLSDKLDDATKGK
jgi:GTP-binding protein EngB required for normal cell division